METEWVLIAVLAFMWGSAAYRLRKERQGVGFQPDVVFRVAPYSTDPILGVSHEVREDGFTISWPGLPEGAEIVSWRF